MKRYRTPILIGLTALIGLPFIVPLFSPWSRINCREYELSLVSGKQRVTQYIYWVPFSQKTKDTAVSLALESLKLGEGDLSWVRTGTFGPFTEQSPHYPFHSVSHQIKMLELVWEKLDLDEAGRRDTAKELLNRLKSSGSDSIGHEYLRELTMIGE